MADERTPAGGAQKDAPVVVPDELAVLPLRDTVLFPQSILPLAAGRATSLSLIEDASRGGHLIGVFTQRDSATEDPQGSDLHRIGTLAAIHKVLKQPDGTVRLVVQGLAVRLRVAQHQQLPFVYFSVSSGIPGCLRRKTSRSVSRAPSIE